jgi:hypothetical protein
MTTILRKYHSVARCTLLGELIVDTAHLYYYRPHVGGELTFADKESPAIHLTPCPACPDWPADEQQRRRDELAMTSPSRVHQMSGSRDASAIVVSCSCGWTRKILRRQNALARASKVRSAWAEHQREIEAERVAASSR